jgi:tRNA (guanine-N7-)-methyltransferase
MGKNKLKRFAENRSFAHLLQPPFSFPPMDHPMKGKWNAAFFPEAHPIVLELGCGRGEYTVNLSRMFPERNYIGIDIKGARIWRGAKTVHEAGLRNVGFLRIQIEWLQHFFAAGEVQEIWITFPDPQLRRSRERKRLTAPRFLEVYRQLLSHDGVIHLKTDNAVLYNYTRETARRAGWVEECSTDDLYACSWRNEVPDIKTTYEQRFLSEGLNICYLRFRVPPPQA